MDDATPTCPFCGYATQRAGTDWVCTECGQGKRGRSFRRRTWELRATAITVAGSMMLVGLAMWGLAIFVSYRVHRAAVPGVPPEESIDMLMTLLTIAAMPLYGIGFVVAVGNAIAHKIDARTLAFPGRRGPLLAVLGIAGPLLLILILALVS